MEPGTVPENSHVRGMYGGKAVERPCYVRAASAYWEAPSQAAHQFDTFSGSRCCVRRARMVYYRPLFKERETVMSQAVLFSTPEMNEVFGRVWGNEARRDVEVSQEMRYAEAVSDYMRRMDEAHEASRKSKLVFG